MEEKNKILQMPFDESDGATKVYDYSTNRADGVVHGAQLIPGKNGNAISFDGKGYCELVKPIASKLGREFTIVAWVMASGDTENKPNKMVWLLNYEGVDNYKEVELDIKPGTWLSLALVRRGNKYQFFANMQLIKEFENTGELTGVSLNQDSYIRDCMGFGAIDDLIVYDSALTQAELIGSLTTSKKLSYLIDGIDFKQYGVCVAASSGILNRPKLKKPASLSWDNYHGTAVDLSQKFYEPRKIVLDCFMKADSKMDFLKKAIGFESLFDKPGTNRLTIDVHPVKPLIYEVYLEDELDIKKQWSDSSMVGTFKIPLIEPEPVKRILKHIKISEATKRCEITMTTNKLVNVYWGDGSVSYDVSGDDVTIYHDYEVNGDYFPMITGCIEEIEKFKTNAIVVWDRV